MLSLFVHGGGADNPCAHSAGRKSGQQEGLSRTPAKVPKPKTPFGVRVFCVIYFNQGCKDVNRCSDKRNDTREVGSCL